MEQKAIEQEYRAAREHVGLFDFSMEGKIKVKGTGALRFLDGLATNDVKNLPLNHGCYAAFLDRFGKVLSDAIIYHLEGAILINCPLVGKQHILPRLQEEAKLARVMVEDRSMAYGLFSVQGPKALDIVTMLIKDAISTHTFNIAYQSIAQSIAINTNETEILIARNDRCGVTGFDVYAPASEYQSVKALIMKIGDTSGMREIGNEAFTILRLEAHKPLYGIDFTEKNTLLEISETGIDYRKGCYVGQEIVARLKHRGRGITPRKLISLAIASNAVPGKHVPIMCGNDEAGFITSAAYSPGLKKVIALGFVEKGFYRQKAFSVNGRAAAIAWL